MQRILHHKHSMGCLGGGGISRRIFRGGGGSSNMAGLNANKTLISLIYRPILEISGENLEEKGQ